MTWQRARSEAAKNARRNEIIKATEALFERLSFEEIHFGLIAEEARFTRSNLYKYFHSKEEIFLEILKRDIETFTEDLEAWGEGREACPEAAFVDAFAGLRWKYRRIREVFSKLDTLLGAHCAPERAAEFTAFIGETNGRKAELLCRLFPEFSNEKAREFLIVEASLVTGLHHIMNLGPVEGMRQDHFKSAYREAVLTLLRGTTAPCGCDA